MREIPPHIDEEFRRVALRYSIGYDEMCESDQTNCPALEPL
jgi:hypothetical protein